MPSEDHDLQPAAMAQSRHPQEGLWETSGCILHRMLRGKTTPPDMAVKDLASGPRMGVGNCETKHATKMGQESGTRKHWAFELRPRPASAGPTGDPLQAVVSASSKSHIASGG